MTLTVEKVNSAIAKANEILVECVPTYEKKAITNIEFGNATSKWASVRHSFGGYEIYVSNIFEKIPNDSVAEERLVGTMIHELIHTQQGCWDHKAGFKRLAAYVNAKYPKYDVKRANSMQEYGIKVEDVKKVNYIAMCTKCGHEWTYYRRPSWYYRASNCSCPFCKTKTIDII